ncbi:MAG: insulinase family protein [Gemmatimonadetes bacterium]|nr:insulinase family protein [Gemmatimonadota bacterium]
MRITARPLGRLLFAAAAWASIARGPLSAQSRPTPSAAPLPAGSAALRPDSVLTPPGGPKLIRLTAPGSGLTTMRLSVRMDEMPAEAGAGQILLMLGLERARAAASPVGARIEGTRTPWGIAYTVVGSSDDFDYLAYVLREAVAEPKLDRVDLERARTRVREAADHARETGAGRLGAELRSAAIPGSLALVGTPESLEGLSATSMRDLWSRTHRRERMSVVVVGAEPLELVLAALKDIGARGRAPLPPTGKAEITHTTKVEVLRHWYGEAWVAGDVRDPKAAVLAGLVASRMRDTKSDIQTNVEVWDVGRARVLAITGAAYPAGAAALRLRVSGALAETAAKLAPDEIGPAVAALRFDLLSSARTPWGLAELVGRYHDATGSADAAYQHVADLERIDLAVMRAYLQELQKRGPARAEIRP